MQEVDQYFLYLNDYSYKMDKIHIHDQNKIPIINREYSSREIIIYNNYDIKILSKPKNVKLFHKFENGRFL